MRGAGCEMLSLILELQTCQLRLCFAHGVTIHLHKNVFFTFCSVIYTSRTNPEKRAVKFFFGDIDFSTSIHLISDIISSKSAGVFDSARQVKSNYWTLAP